MSSLESSLVGCLAANQIAFAKPEYNGIDSILASAPSPLDALSTKLVPLASLLIYIDALCMSST